MRHFIACILFLAGLIVIAAVGVQAYPSASADHTTVKVENRQTATATVTQETGEIHLEGEKQTLGGFLAVNWGVLSLSFLSFLEVVTRLTPSEKDNTVLRFLSNILNAFIPNLKKGGGRL